MLGARAGYTPGEDFAAFGDKTPEEIGIFVIGDEILGAKSADLPSEK
jgi:hypothetical protein